MKSLRVIVVSAVFLAAGLLGMNSAFGSGVLLDDNFTGSDNDPWNPAIWTDLDLGGGQSTIQNNEGHLEVSGEGDIARQLADDLLHGDFDARFTQRFEGGFDDDGNDKRFGFEFRRSSAWAPDNPDGPLTGYQLHHQQETNRIRLYRFDASEELPVVLDETVNIDRTVTHRFRVLAEGDSIQVKWWEDGTPEPGTWNFDVTDDTYPTGNAFSFTHWRGGGTDTKVAVVDDLAIERLGNLPPEAADDAYQTHRNTPLVVAAPGVLGNDEDPDGDTLTAVLVSNSNNGNLDLNPNGGFTYTPDPGFAGEDSFTYQADDGVDLSNVATVTITVHATGGEDPGGEDPGGEDPGGEEPGGEDPGGEDPDDPSFIDIAGSTFTQDILWLAKVGVTRGCNPPVNDRFCPNDFVTRGQMAAFFVRALDLTDRLDDPFVDDDGNTFEADIERLAAAGITRGCNPPVNDRFCPNDFVTRGQMAAFFHRAADLLGLPS